MTDIQGGVGVRCIAIPDGLVAGGQKLRVSLVLVPDCSKDVGPIKLSEWPAAIAALQAPVLGVFSKTDTYRGQIASGLSTDSNTVPMAARAKVLWNRLFGNSEAEFTNLRAALRKEQTGEASALSGNRLRIASTEVDPDRGTQYRHHDLSLMLRGLLAYDATTRMLEAVIGDIARTEPELGDALENVGLTRVARRARQRFSMDHRLGAWRDLYGDVVHKGERQSDALGVLQDVFDWSTRNNFQQSYSVDHDRYTSRVISGQSVLLDALGGASFAPNGREADYAKAWDQLHHLFEDTTPSQMAWPRALGQSLSVALEESGLGRLGVTNPDMVNAMQHIITGLRSEFRAAFQSKNTGLMSRKFSALADEDEGVRAARAKFLAIRSLPTLAKYMSLTVDVEISLADLRAANADELGFLAATYSPPFSSLAAIDRTAYHLTTTKSPALFLPAGYMQLAAHVVESDPHKLLAAIQVKDGIADVTQPMATNKDGQPTDLVRFKIHDIDLLAGLHALTSNASTLQEQDRNGAIQDPLSVDLPAIRQRGLQLIDRGAFASTTLALVRQAKTKKAPGDAKRLYAEDLVRGFRPDVKRLKVARKSTEITMFRDWQPLTARSVRIDEVWKDFGLGGGNHPYPQFQERDDGFVGSLIKFVKKNGEDVTPEISQVLFTWLGDSIAVPSKIENPTASDPKSSLDLGIVYDLPTNKPRRLPALRAGDGYLIGMRAVFLNGSSVPSSDAHKLYDLGKKYVGAGNELVFENKSAEIEPFMFRPFDEMHAPMITISDLQPGSNRLLKSSPIKCTNENLGRMVLRNGQTRDEGDKRYIVAPRTTFDLSELYGDFDGTHASTKGAYRKVLERNDDGSFPEGDRGPLLRRYEDDGTDYRKQSHLPDPRGRRLAIAFERDGATPPGFPDAIPFVDFWRRGAHSSEALPISLSFARWDEARSGARVTVENESMWVGAPQIPRVKIELAPAEEANVMIWAVPDPSRALNESGMFRDILFKLSRKADGITTEGTLNGLEDALERRGLAPITSESFDRAFRGSPQFPPFIETLWEFLMSRRPFAGVGGFTRFTAIHAVRKPLASPMFLPLKIASGAPSISLVAVRPSPDIQWKTFLESRVGAEPESVPAWSDLENKAWPSDEGATSTYFAGELTFDRPSTASLVCEGSWVDARDSVAVRSVPRTDGPGLEWRFSPPRAVATMFRIDNIPRISGRAREGRADLLQNERGSLRALNYNFGDTAARRLSTRLIATSRFIQDYDDGAQAIKDKKLDPFQTTSRDPFSTSSESPLATTDVEIIVPSTARPPKPVVRRVTWATVEKVVEVTPGRIVVEKMSCPRVYLDRPWHASGIDELLAVTCAPQDLFDERPYDPHLTKPIVGLGEAFPTSSGERARSDSLRRRTLKDLKSGKPETGADKVLNDGMLPFATRWGADPTTQSGNLAPFIEPERFSGFVTTRSGLTLSRSQPTDPTAAPITGKVSIVAFKPQFDPVEGLWYVDIGFDPSTTHMPFVTFGLTRYQPYSCLGLELSEPVAIDPIQIPAKRRVEIFLETDRRIVVHVRGIGYFKREPDLRGPEHTSETFQQFLDVPLQNFELKRVVRGAPVQSIDRSGRPLIRRRVAPVGNQAGLSWVCAFDLPQAVQKDKETYKLIIDEIELHRPDPDPHDQYAPVPDKAGEADFFVERPAALSFDISI